MALIKLHNTLGNRKEEFKPIMEGEVKIYSCGPTVYDRVHIGNLRAFLFPDILRRMFSYNGYSTTFVRNITDVDDKTIRKSIVEKLSLSEMALNYEKFYFEDLKKLNIIAPDFSPRATENISEMVHIIDSLLKKELAYKAEDGIYFSISKSQNYGALAGLRMEKDSLQERIRNDEYDKENPKDFALWKFYDKNDGEVFWDVAFGKGRPGWHIECSAMSTKYLGQTFDIHTGGIDLIFPHHTNEIAQSEGSSGHPLSHYWLHNGHILVDGKKMAKSAGNFYTLKDIIDHGISPLAFRYWLLTAHYRTQVNFTWETLEGADNALIKIISQLGNVSEDGIVDTSFQNRFIGFINDDLDTPQALALVFELLKDKNITPKDKRATILDFDRVLGLNLENEIKNYEKSVSIYIPPNIQSLIDERETTRKNKDFKKSDELRKAISDAGYEIKDTENGPEISKI